MSDDRLSRRGLFGLLKKDDSPKPPAFSLEGFYGKRGAMSSAAIPTFELRPNLPETEATDIGNTTLPAAPPPWAPSSAPSIDGVVRVRPYACLAYLGTPCSVCKERCPEPGAIVLFAGRPLVNPDLCTGCGACVGACPAPVNGFDIVPGKR
jgi:ferredoxin